MTMKTLYDLLGVRPDADDATIRAAFRKAAKTYHPDANAGDRAVEQRFREITAAHAVLRDPERRAKYDRELRRRRQKRLREWRITLAGWGLSAVMSAGVVSAGVLVVPKWLSRSNPIGSSFATHAATIDNSADDKAAAPAPKMAEVVPKEKVSAAPPTAGEAAGEDAEPLRDPAPQEDTAASDDRRAPREPLSDSSGAVAAESHPAAREGPRGRTSPGEPDRSPAKTGPAPMKTAAPLRHRRLRAEAFWFGRDRLADSPLRTHLFEPGEVEQRLGFAEAADEPPIDECFPEKLHRSARHHHHRDRKTASRHGRAPRG